MLYVKTLFFLTFLFLPQIFPFSELPSPLLLSPEHHILLQTTCDGIVLLEDGCYFKAAEKDWTVVSQWQPREVVLFSYNIYPFSLGRFLLKNLDRSEVVSADLCALYSEQDLYSLYVRHIDVPYGRLFLLSPGGNITEWAVPDWEKGNLERWEAEDLTTLGQNTLFQTLVYGHPYIAINRSRPTLPPLTLRYIRQFPYPALEE